MSKLILTLTVYFITQFFLCSISFASFDYSSAAVTLSNGHTCMLFDNNLRCWGDNQFGQSSPSQELFHDPSKLISGEDFTCLIDQKKLNCWGNISIPDPFKTLTESIEDYDVQSVSKGNHQYVAIVKEGKVYCDGPTECQVPTLLNGYSIKRVAFAPRYQIADTILCAISKENKIYCWNVKDKNDTGIYIPKSIQKLEIIDFINTDYLCVIDSNGVTHCWSPGRFADQGYVLGNAEHKWISKGGGVICERLSSGEVECAKQVYTSGWGYSWKQFFKEDNVANVFMTDDWDSRTIRICVLYKYPYEHNQKPFECIRGFKARHIDQIPRDLYLSNLRPFQIFEDELEPVSFLKDGVNDYLGIYAKKLYSDVFYGDGFFSKSGSGVSIIDGSLKERTLLTEKKSITAIAYGHGQTMYVGKMKSLNYTSGTKYSGGCKTHSLYSSGGLTVCEPKTVTGEFAIYKANINDLILRRDDALTEIYSGKGLLKSTLSLENGLLTFQTYDSYDYIEKGINETTHSIPAN
jgi:hypothetical protein